MKTEVIQHLHNNKDFAEFCEEIHKSREYYISQLHDVSTEKLQQLSGRILAFDELLVMAGYEKLHEKWRNLEAPANEPIEV